MEMFVLISPCARSEGGEQISSGERAAESLFVRSRGCRFQRDGGLGSIARSVTPLQVCWTDSRPTVRLGLTWAMIAHARAMFRNGTCCKDTSRSWAKSTQTVLLVSCWKRSFLARCRTTLEVHTTPRLLQTKLYKTRVVCRSPEKNACTVCCHPLRVVLRPSGCEILNAPAGIPEGRFAHNLAGIGHTRLDPSQICRASGSVVDEHRSHQHHWQCQSRIWRSSASRARSVPAGFIVPKKVGGTDVHPDPRLVRPNPCVRLGVGVSGT